MDVSSSLLPYFLNGRLVLVGRRCGRLCPTLLLRRDIDAVIVTVIVATILDVVVLLQPLEIHPEVLLELPGDDLLHALGDQADDQVDDSLLRPVFAPAVRRFFLLNDPSDALRNQPDDRVDDPLLVVAAATASLIAAVTVAVSVVILAPVVAVVVIVAAASVAPVVIVTIAPVVAVAATAVVPLAGHPLQSLEAAEDFLLLSFSHGSSPLRRVVFACSDRPTLEALLSETLPENTRPNEGGYWRQGFDKLSPNGLKAARFNGLPVRPEPVEG